ncbi:MAG: 16S rRNA (cytosine(1402)-N(4))-methyltransferase RsmH [Myxococcales bacterium]|nr:16S rRNA (cytosine(1402)-N(4))-methyltransferase RsmH [Myxococcales bacterium]
MNPRSRHEPVLLEECLELSEIGPGAVVVDGTVGEGGHAEAILARSTPDVRLIGLDRDEDALQSAGKHLKKFGDRVTLRHASFSDLKSILDEEHVQADALLLDLGMSSLQLDSRGRGFRFADADGEDGPLDMRMDRTRGESAADLLATADEADLTRWFMDFGELPGSHRLARAIVEARSEQPIRTASDLVALVREVRVGGGRRHHPATRVFQALRIAVNDELGALDQVLRDLPQVMRPHGRVLVIAYHSLEDRRVKEAFRRLERGCICAPALPICQCGIDPTFRRVTRKPVRPSDAEVALNPRARSARLRVAERLEDAA